MTNFYNTDKNQPKDKKLITKEYNKKSYISLSQTPSYQKKKKCRLKESLEESVTKIESTTVSNLIENNIYICDACNCKFTSFMEYYDHQELHNGQAVFKCSKCDEVS